MKFNLKPTESMVGFVVTHTNPIYSLPIIRHDSAYFTLSPTALCMVDDAVLSVLSQYDTIIFFAVKPFGECRVSAPKIFCIDMKNRPLRAVYVFGKIRLIILMRSRF